MHEPNLKIYPYISDIFFTRVSSSYIKLGGSIVSHFLLKRLWFNLFRAAWSSLFKNYFSTYFFYYFDPILHLPSPSTFSNLDSVTPLVLNKFVSLPSYLQVLQSICSFNILSIPSLLNRILGNYKRSTASFFGDFLLFLYFFPMLSRFKHVFFAYLNFNSAAYIPPDLDSMYPNFTAFAQVCAAYEPQPFLAFDFWSVLTYKQLWKYRFTYDPRRKVYLPFAFKRTPYRSFYYRFRGDLKNVTDIISNVDFGLKESIKLSLSSFFGFDMDEKRRFLPLKNNIFMFRSTLVNKGKGKIVPTPNFFSENFLSIMSLYNSNKLRVANNDRFSPTRRSYSSSMRWFAHVLFFLHFVFVYGLLRKWTYIRRSRELFRAFRKKYYRFICVFLKKKMDFNNHFSILKKLVSSKLSLRFKSFKARLLKNLDFSSRILRRSRKSVFFRSFRRTAHQMRAASNRALKRYLKLKVCYASGRVAQFGSVSKKDLVNAYNTARSIINSYTKFISNPGAMCNAFIKSFRDSKPKSKPKSKFANNNAYVRRLQTIEIPWPRIYPQEHVWKSLHHKHPCKRITVYRYVRRKPIFLKRSLRQFFNKLDFKFFALQDQSDFYISNYSGFYDFLNSRIHNLSNTYVSALLKIVPNISTKLISPIKFGLYLMGLRRFQLRTKAWRFKLQLKSCNLAGAQRKHWFLERFVPKSNSFPSCSNSGLIKCKFSFVRKRKLKTPWFISHFRQVYSYYFNKVFNLCPILLF